MAPVPVPRRRKQISKLCRTKQKNDKERSRNLHDNSDSEEEMVITEIATETPSSASVVVDEEDGIIVDETTHHTSSESEIEEEEDDNDTVSQSAADAAEHSEEEVLDMSTHGSADLIDHGDALSPDQHHNFELREEPAGTDPDGEADTSHSEVQDIEQTEVKKVAQEKKPEPTVRKSSRIKKKPGWQESGDYCMSLTNKSNILKDLFSPVTLA